MSLLDIDYEPELDFCVFFEILDVTIKHNDLFGDLGPRIQPIIKEALSRVRVEADDRGRIRPVKEDIIQLIYDHVPNPRWVQFMKTQNTPRVSFSSGTIEEFANWTRVGEPKYLPKLHITVQLPEPMLEQKADGWYSFNYRDILTVSLIDRRLLSDPEWLADVERRKNKQKKYW